MVEEFWGTLSIYDHRDPIFIRSLILFDRIVIPIPEGPYGTLTDKELKNLYENAKKLEKNEQAAKGISKFNRKNCHKILHCNSPSAAQFCSPLPSRPLSLSVFANIIY